MNRRILLWSVAACLVPRLLRAADEDWREVLRQAIDDQSPVTLGHTLLPPDDAGWAEVDAILAKAPDAGTPFNVAQYFVANVPAKYQQAWPEPDPKNPTFANPLIVRLFLATQTGPSGDVTPWCAAFVNWCLTRAKVAGTNSASSQSFAEWGSAVWHKGEGEMPTNARRGDIAVFRLQSNPKQGHVAFFDAISTSQPKRIQVLGGNQIVRQSGQLLHLIDVSSLRVDGDLELIAVRTTDRLRGG